jgi:hypothetical protein
MKPLYLSASVVPAVAPALSTQTHESLRPFAAYLKSAIVAAKHREARSTCPWEPLLEERQIRLDPLDSIVAIAARTGMYRVLDWSGDPPDMPLFIGAEFRPVSPERVVVDASGVMIQSPLPGLAGPAFWAGRPCRLEPVVAAWPARILVRDAHGKPVRVRHRSEEPARLVLVMEGIAAVTVTSETSEQLAHTLLDPGTGATRLRGARAEVPWLGDRELALPSALADETLTADNHVRWTVRGDGRRRRGVWIQLLSPPDPDHDSTVDARAVYCEDNVREVRPVGRSGAPIKVLGFRRESYRLELERLPPPDTELCVPANLAGLQRQRAAVFRIKDSPLPHHRGLLRLCEDPQKVRWPPVRPEPIDNWYVLNDDRWLGTAEQRAFVQRALGTPDFAFLEGPPGSGKTHAICELVLQAVARDLTIVLCSSTHAAVDNVLERLVGVFPQVRAVRIGKVDRVDPRVRRVQIDERIDNVIAHWREVDALADLSERELERAAEDTILASVNLTCGTTTGILAHPYIRREERGPSSPHFDVLLIDEASKTTFQEFLVPAQLARKWVIVGDVRQLAPFSDPRDLEASLCGLNNEGPDKERSELPDAHQRALLLLFRLQRREAGHGLARWLVEEPDQVLAALTAELHARRARGDATPEVVRIVGGKPGPGDLTIVALESGDPSALQILTADWILVPPGLRARVARFLPAGVLALSSPAEASAEAYRHARWHRLRGRFDRPVREQKDQHDTADELLTAQRKFLGEQTWAKQVAWRIGRVHQLSAAKNDRQRTSREDEVKALLPAVPQYERWVGPAIDDLCDVGIRSVIEALRVERSKHSARRSSALTEAIPPAVWAQRAVPLTYQHRMHPDIAAFPREHFYSGGALQDANTLDNRDDRVGWTFLPDAPKRRVWVDVEGREYRGTNPDEIVAMHSWLVAWEDFARANPRKDGRDWEVACLAFYNRQELAIRDMLRRFTGMNRAETRFAAANTSIACGTVDRFQGREADLVLLSLRNTTRPGHMDSPNRLNVGVTRARFFLAIFGRRRYFLQCPADELVALAEATPAYALKRQGKQA